MEECLILTKSLQLFIGSGILKIDKNWKTVMKEVFTQSIENGLQEPPQYSAINEGVFVKFILQR